MIQDDLKGWRNNVTTSEYEEIKKKIKRANEAAIRAEGSIEQIKQQWKKDFGIISVEEAEEKITELKKEIESLKEERDKLMKKLEDITDWDAI